MGRGWNWVGFPEKREEWFHLPWAGFRQFAFSAYPII